MTKAYGSEVVIQDLNLEIRDGSFTVLVGASGCGKSTTLRMITGLETVTKGDIYIDGKSVNDIAPGKRNISMVFQNYALYPTMTVRENIEFGLVNKKVAKEERTRRVMEVCELVGLTECRFTMICCNEIIAVCKKCRCAFPKPAIMKKIL